MFLPASRLLVCASKIGLRLFQTNARVLCPIKIGMPSLSPTMESGTIVQWHKKEGEAIAPGDLLCEVQTDKAVVGMEVDEEGFMAKIIKPEGSVNKVGDIIAVLASGEEDWKEVNAMADSFVGESSSSSSSDAATPAPATPEPATGSAPKDGKQPPLGPAVRLLLSSYGLAPNQITGTGPHGIVLKGDVMAYVASKGLQKVPQVAGPVGGEQAEPAPPSAARSIPGSGYTDFPLTSMRATIAKRLLESKATIPHAYTSATMTVDRLFALQKTVNKTNSANVKVSINDLVLKACAYALRLVPDMNAVTSANGKALQRSMDVDICVAVSTPAGLITPIVRSADRTPLSQISAKVRELAARARDNKLQPDEFIGGSFTISNLGMFGVREFSAIINPPQVAILAIGSGQPHMRLHPTTGDLERVTSLTLTLSTDARFVDEVTAATFLRHVQRFLESDPEALFADDVNLSVAAGCPDLSLMAL